MTDHEIVAERLTVSRHIAAAPAEVFAAWTQAELFVKWWGPVGVRCIEANLDVGVGKTYRIGNQLPDGTVIWISGSYLEVRPPRLLRFTWVVGPTEGDAVPSIVTVEFWPAGAETDVVVTHERIDSAEVRENHLVGWHGCLNGLVELFDIAPDRAPSVDMRTSACAQAVSQSISGEYGTNASTHQSTNSELAILPGCVWVFVR